MSFDPVPWFVGGGAEHSPEVARLFAFAATGGAEGVITPTDLKVTQIPAAGGWIRIAPGACVMLNRYLATNRTQSYIGRAPSATDLPVTPTGSGAGRSDLVIVRIDDPQYGGQVPANPADGPYVRAEVIENVSGSQVTLPNGIDYPAVVLARIDIPANTSTITDAMIKDLRQLPAPRRERTVASRPSSGTASTGAVDPITTSYAQWPDAGNATVRIPAWATRAIIRADIANYAVKDGWVHGRVNLKLGAQPLSAEIGSFDEQWTGDSFRSSVSVTSEMEIPEALRGTEQVLAVHARKTSGTGYVDADEFTTTWFDVEWAQEVE